MLDKQDVWVFLRQRMEQLQLDFYQKLAEPGAFLHALSDFFSRCQDELIEPEDFEKYTQAVEDVPFRLAEQRVRPLDRCLQRLVAARGIGLPAG